jgi:uncharacterized DUF497 family protein
MKITCGPEKDAINRAKHGLPLDFAKLLEWETALVWTDDRQDYGETRQSALALKEGRLYFVAFVDRANTRRVISLRKANAREVKRYVENT